MDMKQTKFNESFMVIEPIASVHNVVGNNYLGPGGSSLKYAICDVLVVESDSLNLQVVIAPFFSIHQYFYISSSLPNSNREVKDTRCT